MKSIENNIGTEDFRKQSRLAFGRRQRTWRKTSILLSTVCVPLFVLFFSLPALAVDYYVDSAAGSDTDNSGQTEQEPFQTLQKVGSLSLSPGDSVFLKRGSFWEEGLQTSSSGDSQNRIIISTYGIGENPVIRYLRVKGDYTTVRGLTIDRNKEASDAVQVEGAANCSLEYLTVKNGTRDGIDAHNANNLLIENCLVHHFLNGSFYSPSDAHGIVVSATTGVTIRDTEVHHVSGDSFQADPNRNADDLTNNIVIEDCHFWTGPLNEDFNSGWVRTRNLPQSEWQFPGENAIDTKVLTDGWETAPRMYLTIFGCHFHGWIQDGYIANKAALNLKEKTETKISDTIIYDCEIGLRLRGGLGNANVTIQNSTIYGCEYGIRSEDNLENLKIYNTYFAYLTETFYTVATKTGLDTWDIRNNYFKGYMPEMEILNDPSNAVFDNTAWRELNLPEPEMSPPYNLRIIAENSATSTTDGSSDTTDGSSDTTDGSSDTTEDSSATDPIDPQDHSHFDTESVKTGVVYAESFRSQSSIDRNCSGPCTDVTYDPNQDGAMFTTGGGVLLPTWPAITSGTIYIQYETRFHSSWSSINHDGGVFLSGKFTRPRQDSIRVNEPRCFDFQLRIAGYSNSVRAGLPTVRVYAANPPEGLDPLRYGDDFQPGGKPDYYYYPTENWIRETYEIDLDAGRIKVWMGDENNGPELITCDPLNPELGFNYHPTSSFVGMDRIGIGIYSSTPMPTPSVNYWHRNLIVSTEPILLGN